MQKVMRFSTHTDGITRTPPHGLAALLAPLPASPACVLTIPENEETRSTAQKQSSKPGLISSFFHSFCLVSPPPFAIRTVGSRSVQKMIGCLTPRRATLYTASWLFPYSTAAPPLLGKSLTYPTFTQADSPVRMSSGWENNESHNPDRQQRKKRSCKENAYSLFSTRRTTSRAKMNKTIALSLIEGFDSIPKDWVHLGCATGIKCGAEQNG